MILKEKNQKQILKIIEPIMDNCLEGSNEGDYNKHTKDFTERLKKIVTPENLKSQLEYRPHGSFTKREFKFLVKREKSIGVVWKQFISKTDEEFVNHAIFVEKNGTVLIEHCLICYHYIKINLNGKTALVGGSSRGLGFAVAKQLALSGASVTLMSRNEKKLKEIVANLENETKVKHNYLIVDFNNFDSYKKIISTFLSNNPIDILVNNTQGPKPGDVESLSIDDYQNAFDLLFKSVVHTTSVALPYMKKNSWGRVLNMVSISIKEPLSYLALSNTIRGSVVTWAKTLANDVACDNITVNNILTGYFKTERIEELNFEKAKKLNISIDQVFDTMKNQVPMKRIGNPEEFGYLASFLCSDNASYITGINIPIDGGLIKSL